MNQDQVFDILTMGYNVFLTGPAGSGKTYLVNRFIRYCHEHAISISITASTGIAATHIGGMTLHSWSGMGIRESLTDEDIEHIMSKEYLMKRFMKTSVLIIDEISMLGGEFLASLDRLLRFARISQEPFGGMQVVIVGDFFQLPPVSRGSMSEFAFEHPSWKDFRLATCVLEGQFRQGDDPLLDILSEIREGSVSEYSLKLLSSRKIPVTTEDHTELFTHNASVDAYNTERLDKIRDDIFVFDMMSQGAEKLVESLKKGCLAPEKLILKKGARVMFVKNNFDAGYVNGSIGHIIGRHESFPIVELLTGEKIIAEPMSWAIEEDGKVKASIAQVPLRLAWAITVHKSQGMTLDTAVMDLSGAFVAGQGYVALSRVRSLEGLILRGINSRALEIDPRVREYDRVIQATSLEVASRLLSLSESDKKTRQELAISRFGGVLEPIPKSLFPSQSKASTYEETFIYLRKGLPIEEIASLRGLKSSTIMTHIESLVKDGVEFDISPYRPDDEERLQTILSAFEELDTEHLSPVREYLGEGYGYDEIRFARLFYQKVSSSKEDE